ncbi:hypothetical protein MJ561_28675 [Klebsiella pneumoniae]|nr:hypothetical protein MJ561_28675 [Klebsiella pneumoniae]
MAQLFRHGYARGTIALWLTYFAAVRDLPAERLAANHSPLRRAVAAAGGDDDRLVPARYLLGGILVGMLMIRLGESVIAATHFLGCLCLLSQG